MEEEGLSLLLLFSVRSKIGLRCEGANWKLEKGSLSRRTGVVVGAAAGGRPEVGGGGTEEERHVLLVVEAACRW